MKTLSDAELKKRKYAFPEDRKFPLPDRKHVLSAIKFFNYISPKDEEELAREILRRMKDYGMKDVNVGLDNRFLKYYKNGGNMKDEKLIHSAKGTKWKNHKYTSIKNGVYIYPSFMYKRDSKKANEQKRALLNDKRKNESKYNVYKQIIKNNKAVIKSYKALEESSKKNISANANKRLKLVYKYQHSLNYKTAKAIKNAAAKGKAFIDKLFKKNQKPKRTTVEALAFNTKLRAKDRVVKRKGLGKTGKM